MDGIIFNLQELGLDCVEGAGEVVHHRNVDKHLHSSDHFQNGLKVLVMASRTERRQKTAKEDYHILLIGQHYGELEFIREHSATQVLIWSDRALCQTSLV